MHFENLTALWLSLVLLVIIVVFIWNMKRRTKLLREFAVADSLGKIIIGYSFKKQCIRFSLFCLATFCFIVALMQPVTRETTVRLDNDDQQLTLLNESAENEFENSQNVTRKRRFHEVLFLVDTSYSMSVTDTRTHKSRLEYAKEIIEEIVAKLDGQNIALYAFTSEVTPLVPPTMDYIFFRLFTKKLGYNEGDIAGTDLLEALDTVAKKHFSPAKKLKTIILLTDGGDTRLEGLSDVNRNREIELMTRRLANADEMNVRLYTIGLGSPEGMIIPEIEFEGRPVKSALDESLLQALSQKGRGKYFFANSYSPFSLAQTLVKDMKQDSPFIEEEEVQQQVVNIEREVVDKQNTEIVTKKLFIYPLSLGIALLILHLFFPLYVKGTNPLEVSEI